MAAIQITERFLMDTGGWQAMRHAKALVQMGRVVSFAYSPPVLRGLVREGETEYRAGLKIRGYTDVENLCSCRESREWGAICAGHLKIAGYLDAVEGTRIRYSDGLGCAHRTDDCVGKRQT